jgi:glycine betaine/proline transport system ATP-binding protein
MSDAPAISFDRVSIVFGEDPGAVLEHADRGVDREAILAETGAVLGVHDATLDVAPGEVVALMGLSGSGKSTLLRAVNGLAPVVRGEVQVRHDGREVCVTRARGRALRRVRASTVAMVFQQFGLLPWRTVAQNVGLALELAGRPKAEREEAVARQLDLVGLADRADAPVAELSGGMQQRVGLARALATDAPILLMDEPFSALDPLIRTRLQDELMDLQAKLQRTIVFVTHDLDEALRLGDRIAIMEGGRIVQVGTSSEIVSAPATDYVADFVAHMNPLGVLCAADLAEPGEAHGEPAPGDLPVGELVGRLACEDAVPVATGGVVTRERLLRHLAGTDRPSRQAS